VIPTRASVVVIVGCTCTTTDAAAFVGAVCASGAVVADVPDTAAFWENVLSFADAFPLELELDLDVPQGSVDDAVVGGGAARPPLCSALRRAPACARRRRWSARTGTSRTGSSRARRRSHCCCPRRTPAALDVIVEKVLAHAHSSGSRVLPRGRLCRSFPSWPSGEGIYGAGSGWPCAIVPTAS
jgi:hypothetical protein